MIDPAVYLTKKELAEYLKISERTADRMFAHGEGPPRTRIGARRIGYFKPAVDEWAASRTFRHRAAELASAA